VGSIQKPFTKKDIGIFPAYAQPRREGARATAKKMSTPKRSGGSLLTEKEKQSSQKDSTRRDEKAKPAGLWIHRSPQSLGPIRLYSDLQGAGSGRRDVSSDGLARGGNLRKGKSAGLSVRLMLRIPVKIRAKGEPWRITWVT